MKAKFFLTLLALSGLLWSANAATAATVTERDLLSQTIANLVDIGDRNLLTAAIDRALLAQRSTENSRPTPAGGIKVPTTSQPIINGKVAAPTRPTRSRENTRQPVIINGIIAKPEVQKVDEPLINGVIVRPETDR
jgi:hypothetical protein